jgi:hypothetical protein
MSLRDAGAIGTGAPRTFGRRRTTKALQGDTPHCDPDHIGKRSRTGMLDRPSVLASPLVNHHLRLCVRDAVKKTGKVQRMYFINWLWLRASNRR